MTDMLFDHMVEAGHQAWREVCGESQGFAPPKDSKLDLDGKRLVETILSAAMAAASKEWDKRK